MVAAVLTPTAANAQTRPGASALRLEAAGWHGRAIERPHPAIRPSAGAGWPAGWSAGPVGFGTGSVREGGSKRVRSVQRMLRGLGYRPGPVDGRFGPRTAAATGWFQYKHGLPSTGTVNARTLAALRTRARGAALQRPAAQERVSSQPDRPAETQPAPAAAPAPTTAPATAQGTPTQGTTTQGTTTDITPLVLAAAFLLWLTGMAVYLVRSRREPAVARPVLEPSPPAPIPTAAPARRPQRPSALGYVALDRDELPEGISPAVLSQIDAECERRGWALARVVHDVEPASGRLSDRPGLFHALDAIASDDVAGLLVPRLRDLTESVADLGPLLRWFDEADARLVVLDMRIDTQDEPGRLAARALAEVSEWERRRIGERTRNGLAAIRAAGRSASREAVTDDPELAGWIQQMRADGMSLQAIADTLNAHGVPTRRGGRQWRPSSVQTALGYRRPTARRSAANLPPPNGSGP